MCGAPPPARDLLDSHQLQFHHIFPKALLKKNGYGTREIDDIANLAFIGGRANRRISDKPPATYIPDLLVTNGEQPFTSHCIPTDPALLSPENYRDFLAERRRLIAVRLNDFLGTSSDTAYAHGQLRPNPSTDG